MVVKGMISLPAPRCSILVLMWAVKKFFYVALSNSTRPKKLTKWSNVFSDIELETIVYYISMFISL
jgi:hypothetical protein